eukprot:SAG11_NODE_14287_length_618_cov_0.990366_2_plen_46_part_01
MILHDCAQTSDRAAAVAAIGGVAGLGLLTAQRATVVNDKIDEPVRT